MTAPPTPMLPVGPLTEAVASYARRRGDLSPCGVFGCQPHRGGRSHQHTRLHAAVRDAEAAGQAGLELVEDVCDLVLGQHARMLYAEVWDRAVGCAAGHTSTRREGTRSAYEGGCRCRACCRANAAYVAQRRRAARKQQQKAVWPHDHH